MASWGGGSRQTLKVYWTVTPRLEPVKHPDVFDAVKRNTHSNLSKEGGISTTNVYAYVLVNSIMFSCQKRTFF